MKIRPLPGMVLVSLKPHDKSEGGIEIPDSAARTDSVGRSSCRQAVVRAMGPWRKSQSGYCVLPDFGVGAVVIVSEYKGTKLHRNIGDDFRIVDTNDVLAVLTNPE